MKSIGAVRIDGFNFIVKHVEGNILKKRIKTLFVSGLIIALLAACGEIDEDPVNDKVDEEISTPLDEDVVNEEEITEESVVETAEPEEEIEQTEDEGPVVYTRSDGVELRRKTYDEVTRILDAVRTALLYSFSDPLNANYCMKTWAGSGVRKFSDLEELQGKDQFVDGVFAYIVYDMIKEELNKIVLPDGSKVEILFEISDSGDNIKVWVPGWEEALVDPTVLIIDQPPAGYQ